MEAESRLAGRKNTETNREGVGEGGNGSAIRILGLRGEGAMWSSIPEGVTGLPVRAVRRMVQNAGFFFGGATLRYT